MSGEKAFKIDKGWPPGHFYSPIPCIEEIKSKEEKIFNKIPNHIPGIDLNIHYQVSLLKEFEKYYPYQPFSEKKTKNLRYHFENPNYSYGEAIVLYCMIRHLRPKRIIEIGSGYSSCAMLDINEIFFDNSISCVFIDPYPELLFSLIRDTDKQRIEIIQKHLQDIDTKQFLELSDSDILFIDSSHVSKINSDVNQIFFDILSIINEGVYIHFHDIFYPFEYPKEWIYEGRFWNESYMLRVFLQYNNNFKIQFFNSLLFNARREEFFKALPLCMKSPGTSIWIKKEINKEDCRQFGASGCEISTACSKMAEDKPQRLMTQELRYDMPEAGEVFLVWGMNGWHVAPEELRPESTVLVDSVMHVPMDRTEHAFVTKVQVPAGTTIDYGFLITQAHNGEELRIWDANGEHDYHTTVACDGIIEIKSRPPLTPGPALQVAYDPGLIPPPALMRQEGIDVLEEWFRWAEEWSMLLRIYGGVTRSSSVLEIGCGLGRTALPLRHLLTPPGSYDGFEICANKVAFLERAFHTAYPNFRFIWADIHNTYYNPSGRIRPADYRFPYPANAFDIIYAASVFTHMLPEATANYFQQSARVLKPGGRCLFSFFLLDNYCPGQSRPSQFAHADFTFEYHYGFYGNDFAIAQPQNPEQMTAYGLCFIEHCAAQAGLEVAQTPLPGLWSGSSPTWVGAQDLVILHKG